MCLDLGNAQGRTCTALATARRSGSEYASVYVGSSFIKILLRRESIRGSFATASEKCSAVRHPYSKPTATQYRKQCSRSAGPVSAPVLSIVLTAPETKKKSVSFGYRSG